MTIYEWAKAHDRLGDEITVWDTTIDTEFYAYPDDGNDDDDLFDRCSNELWKFIQVVEEMDEGLVVDLCSIIEPVRKKLIDAGLFLRMSTESIVGMFHGIVAGYVDEEWMKEFTEIVIGKEVA